MNTLSKIGVVLVGACIICTSACRLPEWQSADSLATLQAERRAKVEKSVARKQTEAELQLAKDAGAFGDTAACLAAVDGILEREPGNVDALLLKAVAHLSKDEFVEANRAIAIARSHDPENATVKRLAEIAQGKQLAKVSQSPVSAMIDPTPTPPVEREVTKREDAPWAAGRALADDWGTDSSRTRSQLTEGLPIVDGPFARVGSESEVVKPDESSFSQAFVPFCKELPGSQLRSSVNCSPSTSVQGIVSLENELGPAVSEWAGRLDAAHPVTLQTSDVGEEPAALADSRQGEGQVVRAHAIADTHAPAVESVQVTFSSVTEGGTPTQSPVLPALAAIADRQEEPSSPSEGEETGSAEASDDCVEVVEVTDEDDSEDSPPVQGDFQSAITRRDATAALAVVDADLTANPQDPQIPISATMAALEADQPETAASIARLGIAFHPSSADLHRTLGAALYRQGSYASSQVALQQALSLDKSSALSYFLLGCVSEELGDAEGAEAHFARAVELDPTIGESR